MSEQRQPVWTTEDVGRIAAEEGIPIDGNRYSFSGLLTHPDGMSRAQIVTMLRTLVTIPSDDQIKREILETRDDPNAWEAEAPVPAARIKLPGLSREETAALLPPHEPIIVAYRGSIAHGMYVPQSNPDSIDDKDVMSVFVGPMEHYLGFGSRDTYEKFIGEWDVVSYELRKFIGLLLNCNPNVLSLLWLEPKSYIHVSPLGQRLIDNRELFVSKKAYHSFSGYAHSQFKRMTHFKFEGYMGAKRKELVERFGYDTKNAAHLIRLLKMGIEFLTEGRLYVERKDAAELLSIKRGELTLEKVTERANALFALAEEAYVRSPLPSEPQRLAAQHLCMSMIGQYHGFDPFPPTRPVSFSGRTPACGAENSGSSPLAGTT